MVNQPRITQINPRNDSITQGDHSVDNNEWRNTLWGEFIEECSSGATPFRGQPDYYKGSIKWITSGELNFNFITDTLEHISEDAVKKTNLKVHPVGTFLMAITGLEAAGTRGACGIVGSPATTNQSCMAIYPTSKLLAEYLYHFYVYKGNELALKYCQGTKQQSYTAKIIKILPIQLPSKIKEQKAIADALSDTDALIESLEQIIAKKRLIKQGVMQELLTGKRRLPGFNKEWKYKLIGDFTDCTAGGTPSTSNPNFWGGSIPWMNSGELHQKMVLTVEGRITEEGLQNSSTKIIPKDCVLIGLAGQGKTRGTVAMNKIRLCTNQSIAAIFPNDSFNSKYLYFNLDFRYEELRELSTGVGGRGGLNLSIIRSISIPFPPILEQAAIADFLNDLEAEISFLEIKRGKVLKIKQGMMQELLTGRIRLS